MKLGMADARPGSCFKPRPRRTMRRTHLANEGCDESALRLLDGAARLRVRVVVAQDERRKP
eukprot:scaffold44267_cov69-Phaeocystis_antarctica.AAC.1